MKPSHQKGERMTQQDLDSMPPEAAAGTLMLQAVAATEGMADQFKRIARRAQHDRNAVAAARAKLRALRRAHAELQRAHERTVRGIGHGERRLLRILGDHEMRLLGRVLAKLKLDDLSALVEGRIALTRLDQQAVILRGEDIGVQAHVGRTPTPPSVPRYEPQPTRDDPLGAAGDFQ
jgi:hypothetical protein